MASEYGTYRVFISSSMAELVEERKVIERVIRQAGYQPFLYERDANARPWNHEETFVQELKASHLYVGIFWNKYGPYTVQEFNLANERGIPRLVFEKASGPGEREKELQEFLDQSNKVTGADAVTIARFTSASDLEEKFQKSFKSFLAEMAKRGARKRASQIDPNRIDTTENLPYLCDRSPQERDFRTTIISHCHSFPKCPLLVILPGPVMEKHDYYVNRVKWRSISEFLRVGGIKKNGKIVKIQQKPHDLVTIQSLREEIATQLKKTVTGNDSFIAEYVKEEKLGALILVFTILFSDAKGECEMPFQIISQYLSGLSSHEFGDVIITGFVSLVDDRNAIGQSSSWWTKILSLKKPPPQTESVFLASIQRLCQKYDNRTDLRVEVLPQLEAPQIGDVRLWLNNDDVRPYVALLSEEDILGLFDGQDGLPMDLLHKKLTNLLAG
jgi:hypothetical protein